MVASILPVRYEARAWAVCEKIWEEVRRYTMTLGDTNMNAREGQEGLLGRRKIWLSLECLISRPAISTVSCYVLICPEILPIRPWEQTELALGTPREELSPERLPDWRAKENHQSDLLFPYHLGSELPDRRSW